MVLFLTFQDIHYRFEDMIENELVELLWVLWTTISNHLRATVSSALLHFCPIEINIFEVSMFLLNVWQRVKIKQFEISCQILGINIGGR